jgi:hypothetical protein
MKAQCPRCSTECTVKEALVQATRTEGPRTLGNYAYCRQCDVSFRPLVYVRAMGEEVTQ